MIYMKENMKDFKTRVKRVIVLLLEAMDKLALENQKEWFVDIISLKY